MKHAWIMTIAALCAACSSSPDIQPVPPSEVLPTESEKPGNESGSRLRKIERVGADSSREFAGWYDSERDEDCAFRKFSRLDRKLDKCLPVMSEDLSHDSPMFVDADCTLPVDYEREIEGRSRSGNMLNMYVIYAIGSEPAEYVHIFQHGDVHTAASPSQPATVQLHRLKGLTGLPSDCAPSEPQEFRNNLVALTDVDLDSFVSWSEVVDGLGN